jgi:cation diffusion facilitator family transporter
MASGGKKVLFAALAGNLAIAASKFAAAFVAGSSSMLTEGIHSLVDSGNQVLMLYGRHRSHQPPDRLHPLGYGREIYFWGFIVALLIFTTGAGMSFYEGWIHYHDPEMLTLPWVNFAVLALAFLFEGTSLTVAFREFARTRPPELNWWRALRESKDPTVFVVLVEDSAALAGILIAAVFIGLTVITGDARWDGIGSMAIGVLLALVAILLARECKALLIGETADPAVQRSIERIAKEQKGVCVINEVLTVQLSPQQVVAMVSLDFDDDLSLARVESIASEIERRATEAHPEVMRLFIRPQPRQEASRELTRLASANPFD